MPSTTFPVQTTAPGTTIPTTAIPLPYQVVSTTSCYNRTLTITVSSVVPLPPNNPLGSEPTGDLSLWLVRPWGEDYEIGNTELRDTEIAIFQEPSFVRAGREVNVYFDGNPSSVWTNASTTAATC